MESCEIAYTSTSTAEAYNDDLQEEVVGAELEQVPVQVVYHLFKIEDLISGFAIIEAIK
jgi:hypothetical protein